MHLYVLARGQVDWLERWKNDVSSIFLPFNYEKGKPPGMVRVGVRPIELLEIVYPEEQHEKMMEIMAPYGKRKTIDRYRALLARILGLKPIPNYDERMHDRGKLFSQYVSIVGIGTRKDARNKDGIELL